MNAQDSDEGSSREDIRPRGESARESGPSASAGGESAQSEEVPIADADSQGLDDGTRQQVYNIFHGTVQVGNGGTLGFALDAGVRRETGLIAEAEISALRAIYQYTDCYDSALTRLRRQRLVILTGAEETGRAAASLMLADKIRAPKAWIRRLPPTWSLADLVRQEFKAGQAYVLHDWIAGVGASASLAQFDARQLADRLGAAGAHLVITAAATSKAANVAQEFQTRWTAPDPAALFAHCFTRVDKLAGVEEYLPELEHCAIQLSAPHRIVEFATRLCDGAAEALRSAQDTDREEVEAWFNQAKKPSRRAVRAATVLALACRAGDETADAPGVTQRGFEDLFLALGRAEARFRGERPEDEIPLPDDDAAFPQGRQRLLKDVGLDRFALTPPETVAVGVQHRPGFRSRRMRDLFLEGLNRHYDEELWAPVREWAASVVGRPVVTDAHLALAYGVGRMARYATEEVREAYLEQWAQGLAGERSCAVFTLWSMASDDDLAAEALRVVTDWVLSRGPERAITAAITFGGTLGKRYPSEAMRWLWQLAERGQRISPFACLSINNLFSIDASSGEPSVARYLAKRAEDALHPRTARLERRKALDALLRVVMAPGEGDAPAIQRTLRESPEAAEPIGRVLAAILRSGPHRSTAIGVLRDTLRSLAGKPDGTAVAARLGRVILPRLDAVLCAQVAGVLRRADPQEDRRLAREIVLAFLTIPAQSIEEQLS